MIVAVLMVKYSLAPYPGGRFVTEVLVGFVNMPGSCSRFSPIMRLVI